MCPSWLKGSLSASSASRKRRVSERAQCGAMSPPSPPAGTWEEEAFSEPTGKLTDNDVLQQLELERAEKKRKLEAQLEETQQLADFLKAQRTATGEAVVSVGPKGGSAAGARSVLGEALHDERPVATKPKRTPAAVVVGKKPADTKPKPRQLVAYAKKP